MIVLKKLIQKPNVGSGLERIVKKHYKSLGCEVWKMKNNGSLPDFLIFDPNTGKMFFVEAKLRHNMKSFTKLKKQWSSGKQRKQYGEQKTWANRGVPIWIASVIDKQLVLTSLKEL